MKSEFDFLADICAEPDNMDLRLRYANWMEGTNPEYAKFIRLQIEAELNPNRRAQNKLQKEAQQLEWPNGSRWQGRILRLLDQTDLAPFSGRGTYKYCRHRPLRSWSYARGCIEGVTMPLWALRQHLSVVFQIGPINSLTIVIQTQDSCVDRLAKKISGVDSLQQITDLTIPGAFGTPEQWTAFVKLPNLKNLKSMSHGQLATRCKHEPGAAKKKFQSLTKCLFAESNLETVSFLGWGGRHKLRSRGKTVTD